MWEDEERNRAGGARKPPTQLDGRRLPTSTRLLRGTSTPDQTFIAHWTNGALCLAHCHPMRIKTSTSRQHAFCTSDKTVGKLHLVLEGPSTSFAQHAAPDEEDRGPERAARPLSCAAKVPGTTPRSNRTDPVHFPLDQLCVASTEITTPSCGVVHWMDAAEAPQPERQRDLQLELPDLWRRTSDVNNPARATGSRSSSTAAGQCGSNAAPRMPYCGTKSNSPLRRRVPDRLLKSVCACRDVAISYLGPPMQSCRTNCSPRSSGRAM